MDSSDLKLIKSDDLTIYADFLDYISKDVREATQKYLKDFPNLEGLFDRVQQMINGDHEVIERIFRSRDK